MQSSKQAALPSPTPVPPPSPAPAPAPAQVKPVVVSPPRPPGPVSRLAKALTGRIPLPPRVVVYGTGGIGKTTLAADAPDPILADIEDGSAQVNIARYLFRDEHGGHVPRTYQDVLGMIDDLTVADHQYKTVVLDTVDKLEAMIWRHMIDRDSGKVTASNPKGYKFHSIGDYGYGKGYDAAVDEWRYLLSKLDRLRYTRGVMPILIGHSTVKTFKSPDTEDYERYQLRADHRVAGLLKEWSELMGFFRYEETAGKIPGSSDDTPKGISTGRRILYTKQTAAYDAKTRLNLPDEIEILEESPWAPIAQAVADGYQELESLQAQIKAEIERVGDPALGKKVFAATEAAVKKNDASALHRYLHGLRGRSVYEEKAAQ